MLPMKKRLTSIAEIVEGLGGPGEVARWADVNNSAVCNWIERGVIPPAWHLRLLMESKRRGLVIDAKTLGLEADEAAEVEATIYNGVAA